MKTILQKNLSWFENSGVMLPADGMWGVAERVAVIKDNEAIDKMLNDFPAWTIHGDYCIMEQRRADCNFQSAFLYLLSYELFGEKKYYDTAVKILDFLYFRSGLLNRSDAAIPKGAWNWSHIKWTPVVYFDDESWCIFLALEIARNYPELEERYNMKFWALELAGELAKGALRVMAMTERSESGHWCDLHENVWKGRLDLPHWGSLVCMALARAYKEDPVPEYLKFIQDYDSYVNEGNDKFNVSEYAYIVIGSCGAYRYLNDERYLKTAERFGGIIKGKMAENGNIPAEHYETPTGENLVDTIYTANWSLLGLQSLAALNTSFKEPFKKLLDLIAGIQDKTPEKQFSGCWRGMYDLDTGTWGGGNRFEGGSGSIYTGWTNAPISSVIAMELLGKNLFS